MYMGYVITEELYKRHLRDNVTYSVVWIKEALHAGKPEADAFYMKLNPYSVVFVCCKDIHFVASFLSAGVLLDLTEFDPNKNLIEYVRARQFSFSEYKCACDELRNAIAQNGNNYRVCGPERECLFNEHMIRNCSEMVGLYSGGTYVSHSINELHSKFNIDHYSLANDYVGHWYQELNVLYNDLGQRKLGSMFLGFVQNRDIIYIGASPGQSWVHLLNEFNIKVCAIDPRDLDTSAEKMIASGRITHLKKMFTSLNDSDISNWIKRPFDLIWDVRSDYINEEQYQSMVAAEIALLNNIMKDLPNTCIRACIKIQNTNFNLYNLPTGGRLFLLPWCIERDVYELRYVFRNVNSLCSPFSPMVALIVQRLTVSKEFCGIPLSNQSFSNRALFYNAMLLRYDYGNYMRIRAISSWDLNLFTLNRNSVADIIGYLEYNVGIISFFSAHKLESGEFTIPFDKVLANHTICDSRVFIGKLIPYLYLLIPRDVKIFADDLLTSDCFSVKRIGHEMLTRFGYSGYHDAKSKAALEMGYEFKRFPAAFSCLDKICTPSGHAMRIAYDSITRKEYSLIAYFGKIIYSFYINMPAAKKSLLTRSFVLRKPDGFPSLNRIRLAKQKVNSLN